MILFFFVFLLADTLVMFTTPGQRTCIRENLQPGDEVTGTVSLSPVEHYNLDFSIVPAERRSVIFTTNAHADSFAFIADRAGPHAFCFVVKSNETNVDSTKACPVSDDITVALSVDVVRASSAVISDRFTALIEDIHKALSAIQADQRFSKLRGGKLLSGLSSISFKVWLFLLIEVVIVVTASVVQTATILRMHRKL
ncbi:Transmembrane emp24 domain-containing protein [Giardia muris]|uniref:Transmembrane emp24 domain-containing protein n=1 Tax=Giardia muris TaxID=5742 RepID=A0A4Z1T4A3_GIAMU|nr:Transmembrane emp24 domain-containing protein [Giardia muris]|eukprot:TNJ27359.1 Transmembrane emp24 domain-containing protein [Giardia muris]